MSRARNRRVIWGTLFATSSALLAAFAVASAMLFVWPATDPPARVDAIVSLAGSPARLERALALAHAGYTHQILLSVVPGQGEPCIASTPQIHVTCFVPDPATTRGEARAASQLVARHHWHRLLVVADTSQVSRARLLFERCTSATLLFEGVHTSTTSWAYDVAYEWGALGKALLQRGC